MKGIIVTARNEEIPDSPTHVGGCKGRERVPRPGENEVTWLPPQRSLALHTRIQISALGMAGSLITVFAFQASASDKRKY